MIVSESKISLCLTIFSKFKLEMILIRQKSGFNLTQTSASFKASWDIVLGYCKKMGFLTHWVLNGFNYVKNGDLTLLKQKQVPKQNEILSWTIVKWSFVLSLGLKRPKFLRRKLIKQSCAKNIGKISEVKIKL